MSEIRTSLEVGFADGKLPERFAGLRGREYRAIAPVESFPYADGQFEVVMIEGAAVNRASVKEAHRVLKPSGRLYFIVPEKTAKQAGFSMPDVYATVREGFDIVELERPPWWWFGRRGRTLTICAQKKSWRNYRGLVRDGGVTLAPFRGDK